MTGKETCEFIVRVHRLDGLDMWPGLSIEDAAHYIWNSSPTGELFHVFALLDYCKWRLFVYPFLNQDGLVAWEQTK